MCRIWLRRGLFPFDRHWFLLPVANLVRISAPWRGGHLWPLFSGKHTNEVQTFWTRFPLGWGGWRWIIWDVLLANYWNCLGEMKAKSNVFQNYEQNWTEPESGIYMMHHRLGPRAHNLVCHNVLKLSHYCCYLLIRVCTQAWFCSLINSFCPKAQRRSTDQWGAMYQNNK